MSLILLLLAAFIGQNLALVTKPAAGCGLNPVSIHFLLDASKSVFKGNFTIMLDFVKGFIEPFTIGPNDAQFGLTAFDTKVYQQFWLNTYNDKLSLTNKIGSVPYTEGGTRTDLGLDFCRENAFTPAHGERPGVRNVLIVITDGQSNKAAMTWEAATKVHQSNKNIKVLGVGVGLNVNNTEVSHISTDNNLYFHVDNWDALNYILDDLRTAACEVCGFWENTNAVYIDGRCINFFPGPKTQADAKAACEKEGQANDRVRLLRIVSENIRAYAQDVVSKDGTRTWIDGNDKYVEGIWEFYDRSPANFPKSWWGTGQPDDWNSNEDCLVMRPDKMLNDIDCQSNFPFLCEAMEIREV